MSDIYKAEVQENADIKEDNKLSADELKVIEELKMPNPEDTELTVEKKTDDYIKTILSDSKDIIKASSTAENNQEQVKAILTFLKVKSFYWDGISLDFSWVDIKNWTAADLVKLLWYNYNKELLKSVWWDIWEQLVDLVDTIFSRYKDYVMDEINNKSLWERNPEWRGSWLVENPEWSTGWGEPEWGEPIPWWGTEAAKEEFKFDNTTAVLYIKDLIWDISQETIKDTKEVSRQYKIVMDKINSDKNFLNALNTLLKNFGISDISFDPKTKKSDAISAFQSKFIEDDGEWGEKVNQAWEQLYWTNDVLKVVDWRLWIRTMNAIINWKETQDLLASRWREVKREVHVAAEKKENLDDKWDVISEIPRTLNELNKYWNYSKEWWFVFYGENSEEWWKDFVKTDSDGKKFVSIWETQYYLDDDSKENFVKREHKKVEVEKYWDIVTEYHDSIKIWKIDWDSFIWQEFILVDWNPKESLYSWAGKREDGSQFKSDIIRGNMDNPENPDNYYDSKWRIDLFDENWNDTKRLSEEQLNSLSVSDVSWILEQAMILYEKTNHKPSEVWRYNLNRIVYSVMKRTDWFRNLNPEFDTPKTVAHMILWMDSWFFSDPSKKLKESDINDITDEKLMTMLNVDKNKIKDYNNQMKYDWSMKKRDQIINRLRILKAFVDDSNNKWEVKKN